MSLSGAAACVAALLFGTSMNTLVGINESQKSTQAIVQSQQETQEQIKKAIEEQPQQVVNNYIDNSVTNIDNSVTNIDNSTTIIENNETKEEKVVTEPEPTAYINSKTNDESEMAIPIGDESNDSNPNPNVVLIKGIKCPECGEHSYTEMYNKKDTNLQHYMGMCKSCKYEY